MAYCICFAYCSAEGKRMRPMLPAIPQSDIVALLSFSGWRGYGACVTWQSLTQQSRDIPSGHSLRSRSSL